MDDAAKLGGLVLHHNAHEHSRSTGRKLGYLSRNGRHWQKVRLGQLARKVPWRQRLLMPGTHARTSAGEPYPTGQRDGDFRILLTAGLPPSR